MPFLPPGDLLNPGIEPVVKPFSCDKKQNLFLVFILMPSFSGFVLYHESLRHELMCVTESLRESLRGKNGTLNESKQNCDLSCSLESTWSHRELCSKMWSPARARDRRLVHFTLLGTCAYNGFWFYIGKVEVFSVLSNQMMPNKSNVLIKLEISCVRCQNEI